MRLRLLLLTTLCLPSCAFLERLAGNDDEGVAGRHDGHQRSDVRELSREEAPGWQPDRPEEPVADRVAASPPPAWATFVKGGARISFGSAASFPKLRANIPYLAGQELWRAGWGREHMGRLPHVYFIEIDNRAGTTELRWSYFDFVAVALGDRTIKQVTDFNYLAALKDFGINSVVLPGTTAIVPVPFDEPLPLGELKSVRLQIHGGEGVPLMRDLPAATPR